MNMINVINFVDGNLFSDDINSIFIDFIYFDIQILYYILDSEHIARRNIVVFTKFYGFFLCVHIRTLCRVEAELNSNYKVKIFLIAISISLMF